MYLSLEGVGFCGGLIILAREGKFKPEGAVGA